MNDSPFQPALELALRAALKHFESLRESPVTAAAGLDELRRRLNRELTEQPMPADEVIADLVADTEGGILGSACGRFFAWAMGGTIPAALAADWLTSAWDQNAALYACGPAAAVVEEIAGAWLRQLLRLPACASIAFVTGCQMAHVTCLAAARHELMRLRGWDVEKHGLAGAPGLRILASNRHGSIERAVRLLGLGAGNVVDLPLDQTERVTPETLAVALAAEQGAPTIVILQAGDLNTGAFDRYTDLIPIAKRHAAWVHIDGAFGLWAAASDLYRHLLNGCEMADSWATDGHKWLNVPYDCGYAFVATPQAHKGALSHRAPYLVHDSDARDQIDWNPEWSRRARGFATYAALRQLGRQGIASLVDRCCEHARVLVERLSRLSGVEVLWQPVINQGLVRFPHPGQADEVAGDRYTDRIIQRIRAHGGAFFMGTTWRGRRAMRISVLNWQTNQDDIAQAVAAVNDCLLAERAAEAES